MTDSDARRRQPDSSGWRKAATITPLAIFFLLGALVDTEPLVDGETINATAYFGLVALRVVLMSVALVVFARAIREQFPIALDISGLIVGVVGAVLWIGICALQIERGIVSFAGFSDDWLAVREAVDPFKTYAAGLERVAFFAFRFALLVVCVPIAEELFLRGFLMRSVEVERWDRLPLTEIGWRGLAIGTLYGVLTHPGEAIAAALWFTMITVLMVRSGRFWNCVVAHAVTNLILGLYVCATGRYELW